MRFGFRNVHLVDAVDHAIAGHDVRGGELFLFADREVDTHLSGVSTHVLTLTPAPESIAPMVFTVPLQLLAYHVAILKGTDVDQPRNLAKSVTVE